MGFFRFRRSITVIPGVRLNFGKKSTSVSLGGRGLTYTIGTKGSRTTVGIPGTGISYTQVHAHPKSGSSVPPPMPISTQNYAKPKAARIFYVLGFVLLVIWLLGKVAEQHPTPVSPRPALTSVPTASVSSWSPPAWSPSSSTSTSPSYLSRRTNLSTQNYSSSRSYPTATPTHSQSESLRSSPAESLSLPSGNTTVTQSLAPAATAGSSIYVAQAIPSATPAPVACRIVNVAARDFLNLRSGPGETYRSVGRIRPTAHGIVVGTGRYQNGSTVWREISVGDYTGWVNEIYLEAEQPRQ